MLSLSECPCCGEGQVGFRRCSDGETLVLLCEQCALVWLHPARLSAKTAQDPLSPEFRRRHPGVDLRNSRWATAAEVEAWGWSAYLLKPADLVQSEPPPPS